MLESSFANAGNAVRNGDGCHIITLIESIITDFANITTKSIFCHLIAEYCIEVVAGCVCLGCNGVGVDGDGFKACALPESSIANADDAAGNGDGCHITTLIESIITDFDNIVVLAIIGYFGWDNNRAGIIFASRCRWLV